MGESLEDFYESITESSSTVRRGSLALLAVGIYLLATAAEITHVQLVTSDQQISLPLINIPVDLEKFYLIAPIIFLCLQVKFTVQLFAHQDRINILRKRISKKQWNKDKKLFLPIALFNLSQYSGFNQKYLAWLLYCIYFISTTVFPVAVLIFFQASFVPYHDVVYTTMHKVFCTFSILCAFLIYIRGKGGNSMNKPREISKLIFMILPFFMLWLIVLIVDFPRNIQSNNRTIPILGIKLNDLFDRNIIIENQDLMNKKIDEITLSKLRNEALANNLRALELQISDVNKAIYSKEAVEGLYKQSKHAEDNIRKQAERGIKIIEGRNLSFATFNNVEMRKLDAKGVDFSYAKFTNVDLERSNITASNFSNTSIVKSNLSHIQASHVDFTSSNFESIDVDSGHFGSSNFDKVNVALSKFFLSALFDISAKNSVWLMNDFSASGFALADFQEAIFLMNNYKDTNFSKSKTNNSYFYTRNYFINEHQRVFGSSYASKTLSPEDIRNGFSKEYVAMTEYYNGELENVYKSPAQFFFKLKKIYEFFMSASPDYPEPDLSDEQFDQLSAGLKVDASNITNTINYKNIDKQIRRQCLENQSKKSLIKDVVNQIPNNLSSLRWAKKISNKSELSKELTKLITSTLQVLQESCHSNISLEELNLPKKIPYLFKVIPFIEIKYIENET